MDCEKLGENLESNRSRAVSGLDCKQQSLTLQDGKGQLLIDCNRKATSLPKVNNLKPVKQTHSMLDIFKMKGNSNREINQMKVNFIKINYPFNSD